MEDRDIGVHGGTGLGVLGDRSIRGLLGKIRVLVVSDRGSGVVTVSSYLF